MKNGTLLIAFFCLAFASCEKDEVEEVIDNNVIVFDDFYASLDSELESQNYNNVPKDFSIVTLTDDDVDPEVKMTLQPFMPPVGDQGKYGTCTSWATGYYTRTIMYARENGLSVADLTNESNQFSPLDIYLSIYHGPNCGGSSISSAFDEMMNRGIAKMTHVPYTNLGNCSHNSPATSSQYKPGKIDHYRRVSAISIKELKAQIFYGKPIAVGCKLGPLFFKYKTGVFQGDDYSEWDAAGKHAGHAMCVVGYDDNKGPNGAFLIANSWGERWGDNGFIWVDYDFFTGGVFCKYAYVIEADKGTAPVIDKNEIDPMSRVDGKDLLAIVLEDRNGDVTDYNPNPGPRDRTVQYNIFNKGKETISASDDWAIMYYYYNATDPQNDYGVVFYDYYTDDVNAEASKGEFGDIHDLTYSNLSSYGQWNYWNYIDIPSGYSVGKALDGTFESDMAFDYELPSNLNGDYYFVLFTDAFNNLHEQYEENNYLFFTGKDRKPIKITNGVIQESSLKSTVSASEKTYIDALKASNPNTYTLDEINQLVKYQKREGLLQKKAMEYNIQLKSEKRKQAMKRLVKTTN